MYREVKITGKSFLIFLREDAMKLVSFKKKKMKSLTKEQQEL